MIEREDLIHPFVIGSILLFFGLGMFALAMSQEWELIQYEEIPVYSNGEVIGYYLEDDATLFGFWFIFIPWGFSIIFLAVGLLMVIFD